MVLESSADLAGYFDVDANGSAATITINGSASSINVIFNKEFFEIAGSEVGVESSQPVMYCRSSDVTNVEQGDTILVESVTYNIVKVEPDNTGITVLIGETT
jgi:hypothetical protein|tara:strand:- start:516 stop:821 length:306 start_codon:yes stop_codon:yes gene_type:complete